MGVFMFEAGINLMTLASDYNNWDITDIMGFMSEIKIEPRLKIVKN